MAAAPESDSRPTAPAAVVLVVVPVSVTHSLSMTSRPLLYVRAKARTWRAGGAPLKNSVEKVVTTLTEGTG